MIIDLGNYLIFLSFKPYLQLEFENNCIAQKEEEIFGGVFPGEQSFKLLPAF